MKLWEITHIMDGSYTYDGTVFTRSLYDSKVVTDKIIADTAIAVQEAINNTAIEGGVLADTFVTVTANGVDRVARTQRDINSETISVKDYGAVWNGGSNPVSHWYTIGSANYRGYADFAELKLKYPFLTDGDDELDFVATQLAVNNLKLVGGVIQLPHGIGVFNRTVDLTGLFGSHMTNLPVLHNKRLRFVGKGSANTMIKGGEVGFGFFEMLGANFIDFEGMSLHANRKTNQCQYGICAGRPAGNASSGTYNFKDFHVYGFFTNTAHYMMSSETNVWQDCFYYPQTGHGVVLSMNNIGWNVTPKYTTFGTGLGGNGVNYMARVHYLTAADSRPTDIPLVVEYGQVFRADTIYFATTNNEKHVQFRKAFGQTFINNAQHEKYGALEPISYYFEGDDPLDAEDYIDYRDFTLINSRLFKVTSADNVRITNSVIKANVWRGAVGSYGIDVARLYDSEISSSDKMVNVTLNTNVKVRVRQDNENNTWRGFKLENIDVPLLALDHVVLPADSSKVADIYGYDTRNSTVQSHGSAAITPVGTSDFSMYVDFIAPTIIDSQQRGVISIAGASTNMGSSRVFGVYFLNGRLFVQYVNTQSNIITLQSTSDQVLQNLGGRRMSIVVTRSGSTIRVYVNGLMCKMEALTPIGTASFAESIDGAFIMVGSRNSGVTSMAKGVYSSAAMFNTALSAKDALNLHKSGAIAEQTCVGAWSFENSRGVVLNAIKGAKGVIHGDGKLNTTEFGGGAAVGIVEAITVAKEVLPQNNYTIFVSNPNFVAGMALIATYSKYMEGLTIQAYCYSTNSAQVTFSNNTAAAITLPVGNITLKAI